MRILVISNLYPPHSIGGYEIGCRDVVNGLFTYGHEIQVLTSRYGACQDQESHISRSLYHTIPRGGLDGTRSRLNVMMDPIRHWRNKVVMRRTIAQYQPDMVFFWSLGFLGHWIFNDREIAKIPSACYISDEWQSSLPRETGARPSIRECHGLLNYLNQATRWGLNKMAGIDTRWPSPCRLLLMFTSRYIAKQYQDKLGTLSWDKIIPWGVSDEFLTGVNPSSERGGDEFRIFYSGQIIGLKGVRTAILGVAELVRRHPEKTIRFCLAGNGPASFLKEMQELVAASGLSDVVNFLGKIDRLQIVSELSKAHAYVFPSEWNEPFSISLIEAMASGCPVVATPTGGSSEILEDRINSLVFNPGDPYGLATHLESLLTDPELGKRLGGHAASVVHNSYRMSEMIKTIEQSLRSLLDTPPADEHIHTT